MQLINKLIIIEGKWKINKQCPPKLMADKRMVKIKSNSGCGAMPYKRINARRISYYIYAVTPAGSSNGECRNAPGAQRNHYYINNNTLSLLKLIKTGAGKRPDGSGAGGANKPE